MKHTPFTPFGYKWRGCLSLSKPHSTALVRSVAFPASRAALFCRDLCITVKMTLNKKREWEKVGREKGGGRLA
ncbi:hypothetical protein GOODEAATRI_000846 [Goodea atripinnis]|uniref:Uncharacterized protein n=1 Tax=Goodea atripinnis TaxID=208336 RepID=A0ABV0MPI8_9TELE